MPRWAARSISSNCRIGLIPGCDRDLVRPLQKRLEKQVASIMLKTKVTDIKAQKNGLKVSFEGAKAPDAKIYDRVLVAVGRSPNGKQINAEAAGVQVDERGFIPTDAHMRTNVPHIYAIGDVVGNPMLAHKATHEAKVAAEVIAGLPALFDPMTIPSVAYTDPGGGLDGSDRDRGQGRRESRSRRAYSPGRRPAAHWVSAAKRA